MKGLLTKDKNQRGAKALGGELNSTLLSGITGFSSRLVLASQRLCSILDRDELGLALCEEALQFIAGGVSMVTCVDDGKWEIRAALAAAGGELAGRATAGEVSAMLFHLSASALKSNSVQTASLDAGEAIAVPIRTRQGDGALLVISQEKGHIWSNESKTVFVALGHIASVAYGNAQVHSKLRAQTEELQQLLDLCAGLALSADFTKFLESFVVRATAYLGFERSFIALWDGQTLEIKYGAENDTGRHMRLPINSATTLGLLKSRKSFVSEDVSKEDYTDKEAIAMFAVKQYLGVPIFTAGSPAFGVLGMLDRANGEAITPDIVRKAETLAGNVAVALQALHMRQISEENRSKAEHLVGLALEMGSSLSLAELLRILSQRARKMLGAKGAAVGLCHEATKATLIETVHFDDNRAPVDRDLSRLFGEAMSEYAATHSEPIYNGPAARILDGKLAAFNWNSILIARLLGASGELLGFLCLADCSAVQDDPSMALFNALIGHASIALENARLFSRIAQSNKQWAELFDSITDQIVVHGDDWLITRVNRPFADSMKVRPQDLVGMDMQRALRRDTGRGRQHCPLCLRENGDEYVSPLDSKTYLLSTSRVKAPWHGGVQIIHVLRDVTERREAERRYQELFNTVQEGVYFSTPDGRFLDVNDALVRMLGYGSKQEVLALDIGKDFYARAEEREWMVDTLSSTGHASREVVLRRKNGALLYALENSLAVRDEEGAIVQYRGLLLDITEAKSFQIQLQRQRDFNTQVLNNTQSMILVSDTAGLISYANRRCFEAGLYATERLLGHPLEEFVAEGDQRQWRAAFQNALTGTPADNVEVQLRRGDGSVGRYSVNMSPMRGDKDTVNSIVIVMTDITELFNMQAKLMHTEKMVAVGQLVSGVAHEVNNPLTAIMGFADLMLENPQAPPEFRKDLQVILQEAERTKQIVQNLLSFARQMPKQRKPVDVREVIRRTVQLRAYDFHVNGIELLERYEDAGDLSVLGDGHQLQQVFLNVLNNAYDAVIEAGAAKRRVEISIHSHTDTVDVVFHDSGPGVTHADRIFDPFFTTKDVGKGTGLGLSICYGIVRQHGGEISCTNHPDGGAQFIVRLPLLAERDVRSVAAGANA